MDGHGSRAPTSTPSARTLATKHKKKVRRGRPSSRGSRGSYTRARAFREPAARSTRAARGAEARPRACRLRPRRRGRRDHGDLGGACDIRPGARPGAPLAARCAGGHSSRGSRERHHGCAWTSDCTHAIALGIFFNFLIFGFSSFRKWFGFFQPLVYQSQKRSPPKKLKN